jgi:hypothetical protein
MCGISGLVTSNGEPVDQAVLEAMTWWARKNNLAI